MDLIRTVLEEIQRYLNDFFRNTDQREEHWVILSNVMDHEGRMFESTKDKMVMFLANITHETIISTNNSPFRTGNGFVSAQPPLYIDLFILFFANFYDRNYREGLGMISRTISFFQQNPIFTRNNMPHLDRRVDKITMEITNLDLLEVNYLMGMLGTKYLPSVYYKLRMIPFASGAMIAAVPPARGTDTPAAPAPPSDGPQRGIADPTT